MGWIEVFVFLFTLIYFGYWCFSRVLPYFLSKLLSVLFKVDLTVDSIQLWRPKLKHVQVKLLKFDIAAEGICIRSSLFNLEAKRILSVVLEGVRVTHNGIVDTSPSTLPVSENSSREVKKEKLMKVLNSLVQFMSLNIQRMTYCQLHKNMLISVSLRELSIDGSILHNMEISLNGRWTDVVLNLSSPAGNSELPPLLSFGCTADVGVLVGCNKSFEAFDLKVITPKCIISEKLFSDLSDLNRKLTNQESTRRTDVSEFLHKVLPKKASFDVSEMDVVLCKDMTSAQCQLKTKVLNVEFSGVEVKGNRLSSVVGSGKAIIESISLLCNSANIVELEAIAADFKKDKYSLKCGVEARRLISSYHHHHIHQWVSFVSNLKKRDTSISHDPPRLFNIDVTLNLVDASVTCYLNNSVPLRLGVIQAKYYLKKSSDGGYGWTVIHDLETKTLWVSLNNTSASYPTDRGQHVWGTVLSMGVLILKIEPKKLDLLVDSLQIEWSPKLGAVIVKMKNFVDSLRAEMGATVKNSELPDVLPPRTIRCACANTNIFVISSKQVGFMVRIDSWAAERLSDNFVSTLENCKAINLESSKPYVCLSASEMSKECFTAHKMSLQAKGSHVSVDFGGLLGGFWTTANHLTIFQIVKDLREFKSAYGGFVGSRSATTVRRTYSIHVKKLKLSCVLSKENTLDFVTGSSSLTLAERMELRISTGQMVFDGHSVLNVKDVLYVRADFDEELAKERADCERLVLRENKATVVTIGTFHLVFPHGYNFAEAFSEHFMGINKWLRKIHRPGGKRAFTADSPLPRDLRIRIETFAMELADDPFEIKLRANYELLEDEHKESLKRRKALDAKIEELRKTHPGLPQAKIEELYKNMTQKDAEIYIKRHRQVYGNTPPSIAVFKWLLSDVEIFALADPSIHGKEKAVAAIREIDVETPWPDEGLEFNVLWCREIRFGCSSWRFQLRDFPQPLVDMRKLVIIGRLAGAEMEAAPRAKRTYHVFVDEPWESDTIERSLCGLKYYHDFKCLFEHLSLAYGPCWEPVIAQCNLAFERVNRPSRDPSPALPFWDKARLLFHGRITSSIHQMTILLHTSLDPYNTTEEMEITWFDLIMDWTNCNFLFRGDFNIFVRTASKYDDCRLLQMPNLKLNVALQWLCLGDPNDHHSVMPCAPDKVPEYSINQDHDSYRAFRSQNVVMSVSMETKMKAGQPDLRPITLLYGSTLKWFENLKYILTGVSRPIRRGKLFNNVRKRKPNLSRHYKSIRLSLSFHRFDICYWMSYSMQRGFELRCGRLMLSSEHNLILVQHDDGLKRRPRAEWFIAYMNCELNDGEVYLQSALKGDEDPPLKIVINKPVEKRYFLSVSRVSYGREVSVSSAVSYISGGGKNLPTHRLVVHDMKSAWTKSNREMVFALYDSLVKAKMLKENLSPDVMNVFRTETNPSPLKPRGRNHDPSLALGSPVPATALAASIATPSPMSRLQSGHAAGMLQKLIAEAESRAVVFSEDLPPTDSNQPALQGIAACQADDVLHTNWLIELVNSQVLLKGCETKGYLILSAAKAQLLNRVHQPVWKDQTLVSKTSWVCILEGLQYYATVSAGNKDELETIMWLSVEHIGEKEVADIPDMVGSGQSVGGVVSETVGPSNDPDNTPIQLQRIVSRCKCEIFYVCYGDDNLDPAMLEDCYIPPPPSDDVSDIWTKRERAVDSFTLTHHDLNICTNSLQYAMVLDVINNLILYVEPHRKESMEKRQRLRFQLQLSNIEDQKKPIQQLQNQLSLLVSQLRRLEKDTFFVNKALLENQTDEKLLKEIEALEKKEYECKERMNSVNEELAMLISCVQEAQLSANQKRFSRQSGGLVSLVRTQEICFKHAQWRLTETDGQLGIADLVLSNFLYTNNSRSDDSVEHTIEVGYVSVTNLLPNQAYKEVLFPTNLNRNMPFDRQVALRVFSRDRAPVGGISIKQHFEINMVPLTIALTHQFFKTMMNFCFPEKDRVIDDEEMDRGSSQKLTKVGSSSQLAGKGGAANQTGGKAVATPSGKRGSSFYIPMESEVEKMKQRAEQNMLFIYIKIPEVPVKVSYKGLKEKNMTDIHEFSLVIPTLEYHNVTWTWLDFFMAMKNDTKKVLLSQAIKQKLQIRSRVALTEEQNVPQEEDKARLLFGSKLVPGENKSGKRSLFKSLKPN